MKVSPPRSSFSARCPVSATISPRAGHGRNRHAMRKKRSSWSRSHSSRRIASRVLPPLRMMWCASPGLRVIAGRVQPTFADGRLDLRIGRVARHARVVVVGPQLVQRHHHRRVGDGVAQVAAEGPLRSKPVASSLAAMSCGVSSATAVLLRLPVGAAKRARALRSARWSLAVRLV